MLVSSPQDDPNVISIMMIDDNPDDLMVLKRRLKRIVNTSYQVSMFSNVPSALASLEEFSPSVCLVDFNLGTHTAFDFIAGLKDTLGETVPVVVMTGATDDSLDEKLMRAGADDYWGKDELTPRLLERCINYAFHRHVLMSRYRDESQRKSVHLANMAHELKQPLNSIQGFANRLKKVLPEADDERALECIARILRNSDLLGHLIHELLDFSHIESGSVELDLQDFDLVELLQQVIGDMEQFAQEHKLNLVLNISEANMLVNSDQSHMRQIVTNLVSNAIKYTEQGSVDICFGWQQHEKYGHCARVTVKDSGIGISEQDLEGVFSPYTQVHKTLNKDVDSTGLGLPISQALIQQQGGEISLSSELGVGSVFTIWLPQRADA